MHEANIEFFIFQRANAAFDSSFTMSQQSTPKNYFLRFKYFDIFLSMIIFETNGLFAGVFPLVSECISGYFKSMHYA